MTITKTFDSPDLPLTQLMKDLHDGKIQLPDFQRSWVWDDDRIKSLIASISLSYPIGALMLLQTGNDDVAFQPQPIEGVQLDVPVAPDQLILDGQQRLTALYQALFSDQVVSTRDARNKPIRRWYYISIQGALDKNVDREDAIIAVPEDRKIRRLHEVLADYSTNEREYESRDFSRWAKCSTLRIGGKGTTSIGIMHPSASEYGTSLNKTSSSDSSSIRSPASCCGERLQKRPSAKFSRR